MTSRLISIGAALLSGLALTAGVAADEITAAGQHYIGVLVQTTDSLYYIQTPEDGKVITVPKDQVVPDSVKITENVAERAAIRAAWRANNVTSQEEVAHAGRKQNIEAQAASSESQLQGPEATTLRLRGREGAAMEAEMRSNGYLPYIKLSEVPLGQALDAILRPMGLEYKVYGDIVYVSTPELLRRESFEGMETRQYSFYGDDTMHKIVLRNPFSVTGNAQIAGGFAGGGQFGGVGGGFGAQGGGFGGGGFGGQGGGFGGGGFGGGGFGGQGGGGFGGQGGGGFGGQGGGFGGGGGGSSDVTATSNISELFSNIDDRMVGEAPATIGGGYYAQPKSSSFRPGNGNGNLNRGSLRGR